MSSDSPSDVADGRSPRAAVLEVTDLAVRIPTEDGVVEAVRGVSFAVGSGQVLGIVGESGSGKSMTALSIMGLLPRNANRDRLDPLPRRGAARPVAQLASSPARQPLGDGLPGPDDGAQPDVLGRLAGGRGGAPASEGQAVVGVEASRGAARSRRPAQARCRRPAVPAPARRAACASG